ncbi:MAG: GDP-mannose 4,6-dehydratase [Methanosarcinaceae archaeon]
MKVALITGIAGQDGSYLAELLLKKNYEVHGIVKRSFLENPAKLENIKHILNNIHMHSCSLDNALLIYKLISFVQPNECYHFATPSFVNDSLDDEISSFHSTFDTVHYLLSSIKDAAPLCRFYLAGSSEMFGSPKSSPQNELTPFNPRSIYGISKLSAHHLVKNYREKHNLYACTGLTYNHESPRRGVNFVTRKITNSVAKIYLGLETKIVLGNIEAQRDWGYAPDYVNAMWKMLNNPKGPIDYVISTGKSHSIKELLETAFSVVGLNYKNYIKTNKQLFRATEKTLLIGDSSKIKTELNWTHSVNFKKMICEMVRSDIEKLTKNEALSKRLNMEKQFNESTSILT